MTSTSKDCGWIWTWLSYNCWTRRIILVVLSNGVARMWNDVNNRVKVSSTKLFRWIMGAGWLQSGQSGEFVSRRVTNFSPLCTSIRPTWTEATCNGDRILSKWGSNFEWNGDQMGTLTIRNGDPEGWQTFAHCAEASAPSAFPLTPKHMNFNLCAFSNFSFDSFCFVSRF